MHVNTCELGEIYKKSLSHGVCHTDDDPQSIKVDFHKLHFTTWCKMFKQVFKLFVTVIL
jgi:hypothetical protein